MSHKVPRWKIRDEKRRELLQRFKDRRIPEHNILSASFEIPATSGKRFLFDGDMTIREANVRKLFACLHGFRAWETGSLADKEEAALQASIEEFCLIQDPPLRAGGARNVSPPERINVPNVEVTEGQADQGCVIKHMVAFIKFLHLRDKRRSSPVYRKFIPRIHEEVDVYDEFVMVRTLAYTNEVKGHTLRGRSKEGIVDLLPLLPTRENLVVPDPYSSDMKPFVEHFERKPTSLLHSAFSYVNGLQYGQENISCVIPANCLQAVLIIDMTSLPCQAPPGRLLHTSPTAHHIRPHDDGGQTQLQMHCSTGCTGAYIIDSMKVGDASGTVAAWNPTEHLLLQDDCIEVRLPVDWEALHRKLA